MAKPTVLHSLLLFAQQGHHTVVVKYPYLAAAKVLDLSPNNDSFAHTSSTSPKTTLSLRKVFGLFVNKDKRRRRK